MISAATKRIPITLVYHLQGPSFGGNQQQKV